MKIYEVEFEGVYPVGNCLIIAANDFNEAQRMVHDTIAHTTEFEIKEVDISKPKVIVYISGDY